VLSAQGYEVVVKVTDQYGFGVGQGYNLVVNQNHAPVIVSTSPTTVVLGQSYRYDVRATDSDGDALTYQEKKDIARRRDSAMISAYLVPGNF
jgi:hypothetical protein